MFNLPLSGPSIGDVSSLFSPTSGTSGASASTDWTSSTSFTGLLTINDTFFVNYRVYKYKILNIVSWKKVNKILELKYQNINIFRCIYVHFVVSDYIDATKGILELTDVLIQYPQSKSAKIMWMYCFFIFCRLFF